MAISVFSIKNMMQHNQTLKMLFVCCAVFCVYETTIFFSVLCNHFVLQDESPLIVAMCFYPKMTDVG